jgi:hypothetical protein
MGERGVSRLKNGAARVYACTRRRGLDQLRGSAHIGGKAVMDKPRSSRKLCRRCPVPSSYGYPMFPSEGYRGCDGLKVDLVDLAGLMGGFV